MHSAPQRFAHATIIASYFKYTSGRFSALFKILMGNSRAHICAACESKATGTMRGVVGICLLLSLRSISASTGAASKITLSTVDFSTAS